MTANQFTRDVLLDFLRSVVWPASNRFTATAGQTDFTLSASWDTSNDVPMAWVNGNRVATPTWLSATQVQLAVAAAEDDVVVVIVTPGGGSGYLPRSGLAAMGGNLDMDGNRVTNQGPSVVGSDGIRRDEVETLALASGNTNFLRKDGTNWPPTADLAMGGRSLTGIRAAAAAAEPTRMDQVALLDGSQPFTAEQSGVTPTAAAHLATKAYVDSNVASASTSALKIGGTGALGDLTNANLPGFFLGSYGIYDFENITLDGQTFTLPYACIIRARGTVSITNCTITVDVAPGEEPAIDPRMRSFGFVANPGIDSLGGAGVGGAGGRSEDNGTRLPALLDSFENDTIWPSLMMAFGGRGYHKPAADFADGGGCAYFIFDDEADLTGTSITAIGQSETTTGGPAGYRRCGGSGTLVLVSLVKLHATSAALGVYGRDGLADGGLLDDPGASGAGYVALVAPEISGVWTISAYGGNGDGLGGAGDGGLLDVYGTVTGTVTENVNGGTGGAGGASNGSRRDEAITAGQIAGVLARI